MCAKYSWLDDRPSPSWAAPQAGREGLAQLLLNVRHEWTVPDMLSLQLLHKAASPQLSWKMSGRWPSRLSETGAGPRP